MSKHPMASPSSSFSPLSSYNEIERSSLESVLVLVVSINRYILEFLRNPETRNSLKLRCITQLRHQRQGEVFEFSEQSVLSNLYWGIESLEAAIRTDLPDERASWLQNSEQMLQVPALLEEQGVTEGISNFYLISSSYLYLSLVKKLQGDEFQVALHFLQALLVSPRLIRTQFAPEFSYCLFFSCATSVGKEMCGEDNDGDAILRPIVRKYKDLLIYYQVMLYGEPARRNRDSSKILDPDSESHPVYQSLAGIESPKPIECEHNLRTLCQYEKVHPLDLGDVTDSIAYETKASTGISRSEYCTSSIKHLDQVPKSQLHNKEVRRNSSIKLLQDIPKEDQSEPPTSLNSLYNDYDCDSDFEIGSETTKKYQVTWTNHLISSAGKMHNSSGRKIFNEVCSHSGKDSNREIVGKFEKEMSRLCFSEGLETWDNDAVEVSTIYQMLNNKTGAKYSILKDLIMDQLVTSISTSKEVRVVRASLSILATLISANHSVIEEIKKKGLRLGDLVSALKQKVQEAAIIIRLINPSPLEIKSLEILPTLVEVICTSKDYARKPSLLLTPPAASLMIIEVLVTAFDDDTNNVHLAMISSKSVLCRLLDVARTENEQGLMSLASILVKIMQFNGQCRKYVSQFTPMPPFMGLLQSTRDGATFIALEFLNEILHIPRSSAIKLLQRIKKDGQSDIIQILTVCLKRLQPEYQLLAANLLLQLLILDNNFTQSLVEEAMQVLLRSVACEESSTTQLLSAVILSNLGGTYDWTGESYTVAWLVRKAGLTSFLLQNMIKNFNWLDQSLQDSSIESWCSVVARSIISIGDPVFYALQKGLMSKTKKVSRDCLMAIAWIGREIIKSPTSIRRSACDILLCSVEQFLHPGLELEERLLACLCIYNYASGQEMQKLIHFSEGVRESLRRLSNVTWIAEELHKLADYLVPNNSRISCVHTQILEAGLDSTGAVTALIYYKGLLCSGYSDGSIKAWNIRGQFSTLICNKKEHGKAVTCFSLFEPGESLLSGSADKTIRIWKIVQKKLECIKVISYKEPIQHLDTYGHMIFAVSRGRGVKVFDASRSVKVICKSKNVKCVKAVNRKVYAGCSDSSIQVFSTKTMREQEIKAPSESWGIHHTPINSLAVYKDWLFSASSIVQGSQFQNWRRHGEPEMSIITGKRDNVQIMSVVEDFIYLICRSSMNNIQIWLRRTQQKVGRISARCRVTSLLTANDMILCGTETGLIMGWIPL